MAASGGEKPKARPIFRKLALGMAVVCFVLGAVFGVVADDNTPFAVGTCLFLGFVMLTIARTGLWPPPRGGQQSAC
jgi:peptidoglycan/LPS O-acetylase OafA/YrhL